MDTAHGRYLALALITAFLGASGTAHAQKPNWGGVERFCEVASSVRATSGEANGVAVGRPRIFDEAALHQMLNDAERRLAELQFIDPLALGPAVGAISGGERHARRSSVSASRVPPGGGDLEGFEPSAPELPELSGSFQSPQLSLAGRDLLAEQLQLTYQVANLRLALEHSLSDRVSGIPVLLGFEVSVEAAARHRGQVAEVQVTIDLENGDRNPSLLTLLPERNTYNTFTITQDSRQIGLGVIAGVFSLGVSGGRESETFYVLQEADTVALQMVPDGAGSQDALSFGWRLRPVLGRKVVEPGRRMLFALISLPRSQVMGSDLPEMIAVPDGRRVQRWRESAQQKVELLESLGILRIETRWRGWNPRRRTTGRAIGLPWIQDYELSLPDPSECRRSFSPKVNSLDLTASEDGRLMVAIRGNNLGQGSRIVLGETVIDEHRGLRLIDDKGLVFSVSKQTLMSMPQLIENRFGVTGLVDPRVWDLEYLPQGPRATAAVRYLSSSVAEIVLSLDGFEDLTLIVELGGEYFAGSDLKEEGVDRKASRAGSGARRVVFRAHPDLVRKADHVGVVAPFTDRSAEALLSGLELVRLSGGKDKEILLGIHGSGFGKSTVVQVGQVEIGWRQEGEEGSSRRWFRHQSSNFVSLGVSEAELASVNYLLMLDSARPDDPPRLIPLSAPPKPKDTGPPQVSQGDSVWVSVPRGDARRIERVEFEGVRIGHRSFDAKVDIRLTTDVTQMPGRKELTLFLADGAAATTLVEVLPRSSADR